MAPAATVTFSLTGFAPETRQNLVVGGSLAGQLLAINGVPTDPAHTFDSYARRFTAGIDGALTISTAQPGYVGVFGFVNFGEALGDLRRRVDADVEDVIAALAMDRRHAADAADGDGVVALVHGGVAAAREHIGRARMRAVDAPGSGQSG